MATKYTYEASCALFDKYGYSDTCEFVRFTDVKRGMFLIRCKTCGFEFERHRNILRRPQKKLRCPKCYDNLITAVLEYYQDGHSRYECAEKFGIDHGQVMYFAKIRGVSGGMSLEQRGEYARAVQSKAAARSAELACERAEARSNDKRIRKEWKDLNNEIAQWRKSLDIYESFTDGFSSERIEFNNWVSGEYYFYKTRLIEFEPQIATCKHCGKQWLFWPSHEKYGRRKPRPYCSSKCYRKHNKQPSNIGHRLRKHESADKPRDVINLRDLYERDGGICQICGKPTDWDDYKRKPDGSFFYIRGNYPTRDHIVPLAKGGTHTWDNVQLACRDCNSAKSDKLLTRA